MPKNLCRLAVAFPDDSSQNDGTIDLATAALPGRRDSIFEDPHQGPVSHRHQRLAGWKRLQMSRHRPIQLQQIDVAGQHDRGRIRVLDQSQQQVLEPYRAVPLRARHVVCPRQRGAESTRLGYPAQRVRERLRHIALPGTDRYAAITPLCSD
jgi:hypothetical protein